MCKPYILQVEVPEAPEASGLMSARDFDGFGLLKKWANISIFFWKYMQYELQVHL